MKIFSSPNAIVHLESIFFHWSVMPFLLQNYSLKITRFRLSFIVELYQTTVNQITLMLLRLTWREKKFHTNGCLLGSSVSLLLLWKLICLIVYFLFFISSRVISGKSHSSFRFSILLPRVQFIIVEFLWSDYFPIISSFACIFALFCSW